MVTVVAEIAAKPGCEEELKRELLVLVEKTRQEEGCVQYDLHLHSTEPGNFLFYENWTSAETLARHAASEHLKAFGARAAELAAGPTKVATYSRIA